MSRPDFWQLVEHYLGSSATEDEMVSATIAAAKKRECIIARFGDLDGERNQPYYQAQLAAEQIQSSRLRRFFRMAELDGERTYAI